MKSIVLFVVVLLRFSPRGRRQGALGTPTSLVASWQTCGPGRGWGSRGLFLRIMTNSKRYGANSSATVDGHEHEAHESGGCRCRFWMSPDPRGCCLSCSGGRGRGTGGDVRGRSTSGEDIGSRARKSAAKFAPSAFSSLAIAVTAFALLTSTLARADIERPTVTAESVRFAELVNTGDRARLARRTNEAVKAYNDALDIRHDPAVHGRLGLILLESGDTALAADKLLIAITKGQAPQYLMKQFHEAFTRVRPKVCFVEVIVSEPNAAVLIDGEEGPESESTGFHVFVTAGAHTFLAKREGFLDAIKAIDVPGGGELQIKLELKPMPLPPPPPPAYVAPAPNSGWGTDPGLDPDPKPPDEGKPQRSLSDSYLYFLLGAGPSLVLGAASSSSLGPHLSGGIRRGFVSVNVDARVSWALAAPERNNDLQLISWAVGARPCAHYKFLFGCGLLQVDGLSGLSTDFASRTRFGGGVHGGFEFVIRKPVGLQVWAEAVFRSRGYEVIIDGKGLSIGSSVLGGFGATTFLTF